MDELLKKRNPGQNALFESFNKLSFEGLSFNKLSFNKLCIGGSKECLTLTPTQLGWPLEKLDLSLLWNLSLNGVGAYQIFPAVVDLFASKSFVNFAKLSLIGITFERTVTFTNMPSLKSLVIDHCGDLNNSPNLPLVFLDNFQLQSLTYWSSGRVELLTGLVAQVRGLENLIIGVPFNFSHPDEAMTDFTSTVMLHKNTLRLFKIIMPLHHYERSVSALKGDAFFVERM